MSQLSSQRVGRLKWQFVKGHETFIVRSSASSRRVTPLVVASFGAVAETTETTRRRVRFRVVTDGPEQPSERADFGGPMSPPRPGERTLNPAHAILAGAVLSAIVTLAGVALNIRSSERLSTERDKRDAAVAEANDLKDKVGQLEQKLDEAVAKIPSSSAPGSTIAVTTLAPPPPQSIVVVITVPTPAGTPNAVTGPVDATPPTTRPAPSTTARVTTSATEQGSTTTSTSSTTSSTSSPTTTAA